MAAPRAASILQRAPSEVERHVARLQPRLRLTDNLVNEIANGIRSAQPLAHIFDFLGVSREQVTRWRRIGEQAAVLPIDRRSKLQRLCVELDQACTRAAGEAAIRTHTPIAKAGGLTREKMMVSETRTTTVTDSEGKTTTTRVVVEREIPHDWRAAAHIGRYRFPEMNPSVDWTGSADEPRSGLVISADALYSRLAQISAENAAQKAIEASSRDAGDVG